LPWAVEARALAALGLPLVLTQLAQMAMPTTDILMLGALGREPLAAAALGASTYMLAFLIGLGPASAVAPMIAQIVGANPSDNARTRIAFRMGLWAILLLSAPLCLSFAFAESLLIGLGQSPDLARLAAPYVHVLAAGMPFSLGFHVLRNFVTALGRPRGPLIIMFSAVALNVVLDYGLIFGELGMPALGLFGAGLATAFCHFFCFAVLGLLVTFGGAYRRYRIWRRFHRPDWTRLAEVFRLGTSIGLTMIFETTLFLSSAFLIGQFGTAALAAHQIAINIPSITFMVPLGIAIAATVRVGYAAGRRDTDGVRRAGITALVMAGAFMLVCGLIIASVPRALIGLYLDRDLAADADAIAYGVSFLYAVAGFQVFDGVQVVAAFALRGLKDVRAPVIITALSYWGGGFPMAVTLGFVLGFEGAGVWWGMVIGLALAAIFLTARFVYLSSFRTK
jgi:MATE family multidrug resistance protein